MGLRSVAAPIRGADGRTVAALNLVAAVPRAGLDVLREKYVPLLLRTAEQISQAFTQSGQ